MSDSDLERLMPPWGIISPGFWGNGEQQALPPQQPLSFGAEEAALPSKPRRPPATPETATAAVGPPPQYAARLREVFVALDSGEDPAILKAAGEEAERLDREITVQCGEAHPHTINIREIRGWLALRGGHAETATRWFLHTTGLQRHVMGTAHQLTQESAGRAVHAWSTIADREQACQLGEEVLMMLAQTVGETAEATARVRRKLAKWQAAAEAQRPGPGTVRPADGGS